MCLFIKLVWPYSERKSGDDGQAGRCCTLIKKKYLSRRKEKRKAAKGVQRKGACSVACMRQAEVRNEAWILQRDEMDGWWNNFFASNGAVRQRRVR